jgi:hypothetical protein
MLFVVNRGHDDYTGGQADVVHLVSRVSTAVDLGTRWFFTDRHAELAHALYYDDLACLNEVPWRVMGERYWQDVKEERQAEFLVHRFFPWSAISEIGVVDKLAENRVQSAISGAAYQPLVTIQPKWYY